MSTGILAVFLAATLSGAFGSFLLAPVLPSIDALKNIPVLATKGTCQSTILTTCERDFNKRLNLTAEVDWTNPDAFAADINRILMAGVDEGLLKVCHARTSFYKCLGAAYDDCISRFFFLKLGYSMNASSSYVQIFKQLEFQCNGGFLQSIRNWQCIVDNQAKTAPIEAQCRRVYENATRYSQDVCANAEYFLLCSRVPQLLFCSQDAGWTSCEATRLALELDQHCPELTCSYALEPAEENTKMNTRMSLTRAQLFRSPNPQFMRREKQELFVRMGATAQQRLRRKKRSLEEFF